MSIVDTTLQEIVNRVTSDMKYRLPDLDPSIWGTFAYALAVSLANRSYDFMLGLQQMEKQMFPQTAEGEYLDRWASYEGLTRIAPTYAEGLINLPGIAGTTIPIDTEFSSGGYIYTSTAEVTTTNNNLSISSIVRSGTTATATTTTAHYLASNQELIISGAGQAAYNGTFTITVLTATTFSFTVEGTPATPATGTITATWEGAQVNIQSDETGADKNLSLGATVSLTSPITDIENDGYVQYTGVIGGTDEETDDTLRARVQQSRENPVTQFNSVAIEKTAREISGVTRVYVKEIYPEIGDVTVLFVRDNDDNIIPDASEIAEVKAAIDAIVPANTDPNNVYVQAPVETVVDFSLSITPATTAMETAVTNSLTVFFENLDFEENIKEHGYISAIQNSVDLETGVSLTDFSITSPIGDVTVSGLGIGILGDITFT